MVSFFLSLPGFQSQNYIKGKEHPSLNKFKDCALKTCHVDYTPQGTYATFPDGVMHSYK